MVLNLGCADCPFWPRGSLGYCNLDIIATGNEDVRADATRLPFRDGTMTTIYAHHILEHLRREHASATLMEWQRVLIEDGMLSVVVPDWQALCAGRGVRDVTDRDRILFGHDDTRGPYQPHQSMWTAVEVVNALTAIGFRAVEIHDEATYMPLVARVGWQACVTARR